MRTKQCASSDTGHKNKRVKLYKSPEPFGEGGFESDFVSQSRPNGLRNLIQKFTNKQKEDVKSIGFGGILELQLSKCSNHRMLLWLIHNFNCSGRTLTIDNFHRFAVTPDDVYDVLMLPRNEGFPVLKYARNVESPLLASMKEKYGIKPFAPIRVLSQALMTLSSGGADFKRLFVLFSLASFLTPSANRLVRMGVIKSLEFVENISKLDWCSYVLDKLCESVGAFQNKASKHIGGCLLLLQIIYFHRLKWRGVAEPCTLPLIQHWTDKKVSVRCIQEIEAGRYGCGELSVNTYPRSENGVLKTVEGINGSEAGKGSRVNEKDDRYQELHDLLVNLGKDANVFSNKYLNKLMALTKLHQANKEKVSTSSTSYMSESRSFIMTEKQLLYVDNLIKNILLTKSLAAEMLSFDLFSPKHIANKTEGVLYIMGAEDDLCNEADEGTGSDEAGYDVEGCDIDGEDDEMEGQGYEGGEMDDAEDDIADEPSILNEELGDAMNSVGCRDENDGFDSSFDF